MTDRDRLIITGSDEAALRMREAGVRSEILPWRDLLNEGPVPAGLSLEELSQVRAKYLAQRGWLSEADLLAAFTARDSVLRKHSGFATVILWFAPDLYDQLRLIQLLDFFAGERSDSLYLIQAGCDLASQKPKALKGHFCLMEPATEAHFALARQAWNAFIATTPEPWVELLRHPSTPLPFIRVAMLRLLGELPHPVTGLSRTEFAILSLIARGVKSPRDLHRAYTADEEAFVMGDLSFFHVLDALGAGEAPLVAGFAGLAFSPSMPDAAREAYLSLSLCCTHFGNRVLAGKADAFPDRRQARHIGGYRLDGRAPWRFDPHTAQVFTPPNG